jgi:hypothetical protein
MCVMLLYKQRLYGILKRIHEEKEGNHIVHKQVTSVICCQPIMGNMHTALQK